ncbi:MAG: hypothetical protein WC290_01085 [archaeon]|jgi:hypothetical protein
MINKINPTEKYPNIVGATIKDIKNDYKEDLMQKIDRNKENWSVCLFAEEIKKKIDDNEYKIVLRFDFSDKDEFGNPILDLEVFENGKKTDKFKKYHHTVKKNEVYTLSIDKFLELELELEIMAVSAIAAIVDFEEAQYTENCKIIRNNNKIIKSIAVIIREELREGIDGTIRNILLNRRNILSEKEDFIRLYFYIPSYPLRTRNDFLDTCEEIREFIPKVWNITICII